MSQSQVAKAEKMPSQEKPQKVETEMKPSTKLRESKDIVGKIKVRLDVYSNKSLGVTYATKEQMRELFMPVLEKIGDADKQAAQRISESDEDPLKRGEQAAQEIAETKQSLSDSEELLLKELNQLVDGLALMEGGENKGILKLNSASVDLLNKEEPAVLQEGTNTLEDNRKDIPVGYDVFVVSQASKIEIGKNITNLDSRAGCSVVKDKDGILIAKFGEKSVAFLTSGRVELNRDTEEITKEDEDMTKQEEEEKEPETDQEKAEKAVEEKTKTNK